MGQHLTTPMEACSQPATKPAPRLLDVFRDIARRKGFAHPTVGAWAAWVTSLVNYTRRRHLRELKIGEVGQFLEKVAEQAPEPLVAIEEARQALEFLAKNGDIQGCFREITSFEKARQTRSWKREPGTGRWLGSTPGTRSRSRCRTERGCGGPPRTD